MLLFTNRSIYREPEAVQETGRIRDYCSAIFFVALHLLEDLLCVGVDRFALRCKNILLSSPIGWVGYLPTRGPGAD